MLIRHCKTVLRTLCQPCSESFSAKDKHFSVDIAEAFDFLTQKELPEQPTPVAKQIPKPKVVRSEENTANLCRFPFKRASSSNCQVSAEADTSGTQAHEKFATELVKHLDNDQLAMFLELLHTINHQNKGLHSRSVDCLVSQFLKRNVKDHYEQLVQLLENCDRSQLTLEKIGATAHFCDTIVEGENRSVKNHMLLTEVMPKTKRNPHSLFSLEEDKSQEGEPVNLYKDDDITLEQLAFVAKNSQKANIETIDSEVKNSSEAFTMLRENMELVSQLSKNHPSMAEQTNSSAAQAQNLQQLHQIIMLEKAEKIAHEPNYGRNWVYAYDLPYDLTSEAVDELIKQVQAAYGKVESYRAFPYANMVEKTRKEFRFVLPEELNLTQTFDEDQLSCLLQEKAPLDKSLQHNAKKRPTSTERILKRLESRNEHHLNKSYVLFRFIDYASKEKLLSPDMRLFGWNQQRNGLNVRFDDAMEKKSIILNGLPWGTKLGNVQSWINSLLDEYGYSNLRSFCLERDKILTKNYVFFTLCSYWESLKVLQILNGQQLAHATVKARHVYGSLRAFNSVYTQNIGVQTNQYLKARLKLIKQRPQRPQRPNCNH